MTDRIQSPDDLIGSIRKLASEIRDIGQASRLTIPGFRIERRKVGDVDELWAVRTADGSAVRLLPAETVAVSTVDGDAGHIEVDGTSMLPTARGGYRLARARVEGDVTAAGSFWWEGREQWHRIGGGGDCVVTAAGGESLFNLIDECDAAGGGRVCIPAGVTVSWVNGSTYPANNVVVSGVPASIDSATSTPVLDLDSASVVEFVGTTDTVTLGNITFEGVTFVLDGTVALEVFSGTVLDRCVMSFDNTAYPAWANIVMDYSARMTGCTFFVQAGCTPYWLVSGRISDHRLVFASNADSAVCETIDEFEITNWVHFQNGYVDYELYDYGTWASSWLQTSSFYLAGGTFKKVGVVGCTISGADMELNGGRLVGCWINFTNLLASQTTVAVGNTANSGISVTNPGNLITTNINL